MGSNRQLMDGNWRTLRKLSYVGLIWMCACYIAFRFGTGDLSQNPFLGVPAQRALLQKLPQDATGSADSSANVIPQGVGAAPGPSTTQTSVPSSGVVDRDVKIDKDAKNIDDILSQLKEVSNIPYAYWDPKIPKPPITSKSCVKYPPLYDLQFNNLYWQKLNTNNGSFFIYGAYLDIRQRVGKVPLVRILAMIDRIKPTTKYCLLWYDNATMPVVSLASYTYAWYSRWGNYKDGLLQPFIVSCPAPFQKGRGLYPSSVSLVERQCTPPTNNVRVIHNAPEIKQDFAVCVKGLDFLKDDLSVRLVEWIELLNILGAKKIFFYELEVHPNISKVLQHYVGKGIVDNTPLTLPGDMPNLPALRHQFLKQRTNHKRQNELIPYNDCLYRNLYSYDFIALLDIDEVIMPINHEGWADLMREAIQPQALKEHNYTRASYNFRNVYFMDDMLKGEEMKHEVHEVGIPPYMHMLQHVYRAKNFTKPGAYVKCFHDTQRVVSLHNHFPLNCFGSCTTYSVPPEIAQMQHYRKDCVGPLQKSCESEFKSSTIRDTTIWRYKDELITRVTATLQKLDFFAS
ncbi:uncharacterized protein LOC111248999 [Varroa destructor]|uniref:Glycosyltransferase family 92 protein n=2 Tax=Varroa TaxID=62624 RepID=A0A7M7K5L2_VARDE|nr:uncharacterized protein LOC111248999 [Varroa destructor]